MKKDYINLILHRVWLHLDSGNQYYFEWKNRRTSSYLNRECFILKKGCLKRESLGYWSLNDNQLFIGNVNIIINFIAELSAKFFRMKWTHQTGEELQFICSK